MFKKSVVKLSNGKYAIAKYINLLGFRFWYRFVDLENTNFLWEPGDRFFSSCMGSMHEVKRVYCNFGAGVKVEEEIKLNCNETD